MRPDDRHCNRPHPDRAGRSARRIRRDHLHPGSTPAATDWRDDGHCGFGLHFGPTPSHARVYRSDAARYVQVGVRVDELRPILGGTAKCKAPRVVRACVEVDLFGQPVTAGVAA